MNVVKNEKQIIDDTKKEELIKRTEVPNSPFVVITTKEGSFGVLGKYRLTEVYATEKEAIAGTSAMTWNRIIQVMSLVNTILNEAK